MVDSPPATIEALLERIASAYGEFSAAIAAFSDEQIVEQNTLGSWSIRDVIAHVGADEQWMAGQLEALAAGELPSEASCYGGDVPPPAEGIDLSTQDGRNAWQRERLAGLSLDDVLNMAATSHNRLTAAIESFADEQLTEKLTIAGLGTTGHIRKPEAGETGWPLWEWLRGVTYHHYVDHANDILTAASR